MSYKTTNEAARDEHAVIGGVAGKKVFLIDNAGNQITSFGANATVAIGSAATIYAVVNTAAAGVTNSIVTVANSVEIAVGANQIGSVTVANPVTLGVGTSNIGFATVALSTPTVYAVVNTSAPGITNSIVTVANPVTLSGNVTLDDGSLTGLIAGVNYIGLASVNVGGTLPPLSTGANFIGLVTITGVLGANSGVVIGDVRDAGSAGVLLQQEGGGSYGLKVTHYSNVTLAPGPNFVGLVTAVAQSTNVGTSKTLIPLSIAMSTNSIATLAVGTGGNAIFKITNVLLNSDASVRISIKSGATYLTGNASIGITLNPGGGWVETGAPDSPTYLGLASGAAIVLEKLDLTATIAKIGGKIVYFQE